MADVQDVNLIFAHGEEDPVFVVAMAVEDFADFHVQKLAFGHKWSTFWKKSPAN